MSRESNDGFVCQRCDNVVYLEQCACDTDHTDERVTLKSASAFIAQVFFGFILVALLIILWLSL